MIKHIIKLSLRNLYRYRLYALINIGGLAIALGCSFLIYLFILHETSYDKFHKNSDNIYRVKGYYNFGPGELVPMDATSINIGPYFEKDFPEVINYIIISTARSTQRTIEIGIRKVVGAGRKNLFKQIMSESIIFSFIAFPIAIIIAELLLPTMNNLFGKEMIISYLNNWKFVCGMVLITLFIGLISGTYLSMYLSRFRPEHILRKRFTNKNTQGILIKILISTQLVIFIVLFIFSEIIYKQLRFIESNNPGFTTSNLLIVKPPHDHALTSCAGFVNEINNNSDIICVSEVSAGIFTDVSNIYAFSNPEIPENKKRIFALSADYNFINAYGFNILDG